MSVVCPPLYVAVFCMLVVGLRSIYITGVGSGGGGGGGQGGHVPPHFFA